MKTKSVLIASTAILFSHSAFAFENDGFFIEGNAELSHFDTSGGSEEYIHADLDFGYRPDSTSSQLPIGFTLGVEYFESDIVEGDALYPTVDIYTSYGTWSVGIPRSVVDSGYVSDHDLGYSNLFSLEFSQITESVFRAFYLLGASDVDVNGGLRWDGEFGNTKVGFSYHSLDASGLSADVVAIAARHDFGQVGGLDEFAVYGSYENLDASGTSLDSFILGFDGQYQKLGFGIKRSEADIGTDFTFTELYADYQVLPDLLLDVGYTDISNNSNGIYGIGARYNFYQGAYVDVGYLDSTASDSEGVWDLSLGWAF